MLFPASYPSVYSHCPMQQVSVDICGQVESETANKVNCIKNYLDMFCE